MKTKNGASVLTLLLVFCGAADARPPDYTLTFNLHETPGDPASPIDFTITMGLMKDTVNGNDIGWLVNVVTIRKVDGQGNVLTTWSKNQPFVDTEDGLWWIEHADPNAPVNSEFLVPPLISGTAPSPNPNVVSLEFEFEGAMYVAPPEGAPYDDTSSLTALLRDEGTPPPPPKKDIEDEPVEMPDEPLDPYPT